MTNNEIAVLVTEGEMLRGIVAETRGSGEVIRIKSASWSMADSALAEEIGDSGSDASFGMPDDPEAGSVAADDTPRVRALRAAKAELGSSKFIFGVPMSQLVVQVLSFPIEMREALDSAVSLQLEKNSPYSADEMTVGYEILQETDRDIVVFAAGLPDLEADRIREDAELAGCEIVRVDIPLLGWFRALLSHGGGMAEGCRIFISKMNSVWNILVARNGILVCARSVLNADSAALAREVLLTVQTAETLCGGMMISEIILFAPSADGEGFYDEELKERLSRILDGAPVTVKTSDDCYLSSDGLARRAAEPLALDLTPHSWKQERQIRKIERRIKFVSIGISSVAVCVIAALLAAPWVYGWMTDRQRKIGRQHASAYKKVSDTRAKVRLIESYTDRSGSALEMLRMASSAISGGIVFTSFSYRRHDALKISAEADSSQEVYGFKDAIASNPNFVKVDLTGPSKTRNGKLRFEITATLQGMEGAEEK